MTFQTQLRDTARYNHFPLQPSDPRCPHCGGEHIGNTGFSLPTLGYVQGSDSMEYDKTMIILCPNHQHPSASMTPDFPRFHPLPATKDYDPNRYPNFSDDKGILPFAEYMQHAFPSGYTSRHAFPLKGAYPHQDNDRKRLYTASVASHSKKRPGSGFIFDNSFSLDLPTHSTLYTALFEVGLPTVPFHDRTSLEFTFDTGALYSTLTPEAFDSLSIHFGNDLINNLLVHASTLAYPLLGDSSRAHSEGHWLLLLLSPSISFTPEPILVFVGANVVNVLAVTSIPTACWMNALFSFPPRALPAADPPLWSVREVIDSTSVLSRYPTDIRLFRPRPVFVQTSLDFVMPFDFFLDTGSPINLWPQHHQFNPPDATRILHPFHMSTIGRLDYRRARGSAVDQDLRR